MNWFARQWYLHKVYSLLTRAHECGFISAAHYYEGDKYVSNVFQFERNGILFRGVRSISGEKYWNYLIGVKGKSGEPYYFAQRSRERTMNGPWWDNLVNAYHNLKNEVENHINQERIEKVNDMLGGLK